MGKYQGYERYKDSGVEWLGEIPESWEIVRFSHFITFQEGPGIMAADFRDEGIPLLRIHNLKPGFVDLEGCNYLDPEKVEKTWKHFKLKRNDILISCSASTGLISIVDEKSENSIAYTGIIRLNPARCEINRQFIQVLVGSDLFFTQIDLLKTGTTIQHYGPVHLRQIKITLPPLEEQETIAQFLDHKTSQIDALISKKEALLQKLDEKRTALISHAVTKGLDPSVPMKDSGIEWLGEIPKHWTMMPVKRFSEIYDCKHKTVSFVDDGLPVASIAQVQNFYLDLSGAKKTTKEEFLEMIEGGREPRNGDIIFSRNATVGASAIVENELFCMGQDVCLIRPKKANTVFLNYNFFAFFIKSQIDQCLLGSTFKRINVEEVKNLVVCLPSIDEQQKIAQYIDIKTSEIDQQKTKIKQAIDLLKEYRTALITNAVTGKIDVRQVPIPQP